MSKNSVVIYHDSCTDGFCAAWLLYEYFRTRKDEHKAYENVEYIPWQYGNKFDVSRLRDKVVYIADFSFPIPVMDEILAVCSELFWFDHHETALPIYENFKTLENNKTGPHIHKLLARFDLTKSGAMLVYNYLVKAMTPNCTSYKKLVEYVQDRDLWTFGLAYSRYINNALALEDFSFEAYCRFALQLHSETCFGNFVRIGMTVEKVIEQQIENLLKYKRQIRIGDYVVEACNCPVSMLVSKLGNALAQLAESGVGCVYFQLQNGDWMYSLRGTGKVKVNDLAKLHGGGGHPNAAGFRSPILMV